MKSVTAKVRLEQRARSRKDWEVCRRAAESGAVSRKTHTYSFVNWHSDFSMSLTCTGEKLFLPELPQTSS